MNDLRTAAQQALETLEALQGGCTDSDDGTVEAITVWCPEVIDALRAALAEPVQEPVAWLLQSELDELLTCNHMGLGADSPTIWAPYDISTPSADMGLVPVYTAPPQRKPLSEEEIYSLFRTVASPVMFARAIERAHGIV